MTSGDLVIQAEFWIFCIDSWNLSSRTTSVPTDVFGWGKNANLSEAPRAYRKPIGFTNNAVTDRIHAGAAQKECFALSSSSPSDFDDDDGVPVAAVGMDDTPVRVSEDHHSSSSQMLQTASHDEIRVNRSLLARPHLLTVANSSSTTSLWFPSPPIDLNYSTLVQDDDEEDLPLMATIRLSRMEPNNHNETQEEEDEEQQAPLALGYFSGETIYRNKVIH